MDASGRCAVSFRCAISFLILVLAVPTFAATDYWTGAGGNPLWSNPANWQGNAAPVDGDDLIFTVTTGGLSTTNDFASITLRSVTAAKSSLDTFIHGTVSIGGNGFRITNTLGNNLILDVPVTLAASQTWLIANYPSAELRLNGTVNLNGYTLTVGGNKNFVTFNGDVIGAGAMNLSGGCDTGYVTFNGHVAINGSITQVCGSATFTNTNTFTGPIVMTGNWNNTLQTVDLSVPGGFPSGCQVIFSDTSTGTLSIGPGAISQPSLSGSGNIRLNGGSVTLTNAANTTFHGVIYGPGTLGVTGGAQTLALSGAMTTIVTNNAILFIDGANVSGAPTSVGPGELKLRTAHLGSVNASGGTLSPLLGNTATTLTLSSSSNFVATLGSSQISVSGNVSIGSSALTLSPKAQPTIGDQYTIIANTGSGSTTGTFAGYPEGATFTLNGLTYTITYHGGSSGKDVVVTLAGTGTQTTLTSNPNPSPQGHTVTLLAAVTSSGSPVTTGSVTFRDGTNPLGTVALTAGGNATLQTSTLSPGTHSLTATFNGSGSFATSTSAAVTQVVNPTAPTQTTLTASPNPSQVSQPVTLTATVTASGNPSGTVTFFDGSSALRTMTLNAGSATYTVSSLGIGQHTLTATYNGDDAFSPSTSQAMILNVKGGVLTQTTLTTSDDTTELGEPVTFSAVVQSAFGIPDGNVVFSDGGASLAIVPLDVNGYATYTTSALTVGSHALMATFQAGNGFSASSSSPLTQHILGDCPFPILVSALQDEMVPMHSDVALSVSTASGQQEQFAWFSGDYPDTTQPLGVITPSLTLQNLAAPVRLWVRVTNTCGTVYSAATISVPTPPRRRAVVRR